MSRTRYGRIRAAQDRRSSELMRASVWREVTAQAKAQGLPGPRNSRWCLFAQHHLCHGSVAYDDGGTGACQCECHGGTGQKEAGA